MFGLIGYGKIFKFYFKGDGKPLEDFKQGHGMI